MRTLFNLTLTVNCLPSFYILVLDSRTSLFVSYKSADVVYHFH